MALNAVLRASICHIWIISLYKSEHPLSFCKVGSLSLWLLHAFVFISFVALLPSCHGFQHQIVNSEIRDVPLILVTWTWVTTTAMWGVSSCWLAEEMVPLRSLSWHSVNVQFLARYQHCSWSVSLVSCSVSLPQLFLFVHLWPCSSCVCECLVWTHLWLMTSRGRSVSHILAGASHFLTSYFFPIRCNRCNHPDRHRWAC